VRLLTCATRSVAPTPAGERLLRTIGPRLEEIEAELDALSDFREKPAGTIRITAGDHATGREINVRVDGQLVFNGIYQVLNAALDGFGLAYVPQDLAQPHLASGRLARVLEAWSPPWSGYHLCYPSRRQPSAAFTLLLDALRHRGPH
jgi:DNA-binding transcriptional LysR family regulator